MSCFYINIDLVVAGWDFGKWNVKTLTGGRRWIVDSWNGALNLLATSRDELKCTGASFFKELINGNPNC